MPGKRKAVSPDVESRVEDIDLLQLVQLCCGILHLVFHTVASTDQRLPNTLHQIHFSFLNLLQNCKEGVMTVTDVTGHTALFKRM